MAAFEFRIFELGLVSAQGSHQLIRAEGIRRREEGVGYVLYSTVNRKSAFILGSLNRVFLASCEGEDTVVQKRTPSCD